MMLKSTLFLLTGGEEKNYNEELDFNLTKSSASSASTIIVSTCILISIFGLITNGILFWFLCCNIKKTKFIKYVVNMIAGDLLVLLHSFVFFMAWFVPALISNRIYKAFLMLLILGYETNSYFLAAMSIERCLVVFSPACYQSHRQKCSTILVCAFIWILSVPLKLIDYFICKKGQIIGLPTYSFPCKFTIVFRLILLFGIIFSTIISSNLALCIRMKIKPENDFPARLDFSIWGTVVLHLMIFPFVEIIQWLIIFDPKVGHHLDLLYIIMICYPVGSSVSPFVYLVVGCWKWEKGQQPFYMFLERALKDDGKNSMRTQPDQEQV